MIEGSDEYRYIGEGKGKLVDGPDLVTGRAQYGINTRLDGLRYVVVSRPPPYLRSEVRERCSKFDKRCP